MKMQFKWVSFYRYRSFIGDVKQFVVIQNLKAPELADLPETVYVWI